MRKRVTQSQIARRLGLDNSTCNKILNGAVGMTFSEDTKRRVFEMADKLGYDYSRPHKGNLSTTLKALFPETVEDVVLAEARGISVEKVREIKSLIYKRTA